MKKIFALFIIILINITFAYSQDIKKFHFHDKKELIIEKIHEKELSLEIFYIAQPEKFYFSKELEMELKKIDVLKPVQIKRGFFKKIWYFFKKIFIRESNFNYKIDFKDLPQGLYFFQLKGEIFKKDYYILISQYKLITKLLYNTCDNYLIDTSTGEPVEDYKLILINDKTRVSLTSKEKPFYNVLLSKQDYSLIAFCSNQYDVNIIKEEQIEYNKIVPFIKILLPKTYFSIGEKLFFNVLLRERDNFHYNTVPVPSAEISIYDNKDNLIKSKKVTDVIKGYIVNNFIIDDMFKEGEYYIRVKWGDYKQKEKIYILRKYATQLYFKILTDKDIYYCEENIKLEIEILNKYGNYLQEASLTCDLLIKKLDSNKQYQYLTSFKAELKKGKKKFNIIIPKILEKGNYYMKIIAKVRSNNGFREADYCIIKILNSDFDIRIKNDFNIFEIGQPVELIYKLIPLTAGAQVKKFKFSLFKIDNFKEKSKSSVMSEELEIDKNKLVLNINKSGLYEAQFLIQDDKKHVIKKNIDLWVLSYTYGIDIKEKLDDIIIVQNKKRYDYSDIGKILIIFPDKEIWYNISIEGNETYHNAVEFAEKNHILFDFPLYEKYSPEVFLKVIAYKKNKLYYNQKSINIPYIGKYLRINSELSNIHNNDNVNRIEIKPSNYWGYALENNILFYTINKDFRELYNKEENNLYAKLYGSLDNYSVLINHTYYENRDIKKNHSEPYLPGYIYSDYIKESLNNYELMFLNKKETGKRKFKYFSKGSWVSYLFGFTDDTKIGLTHIDHFYKNDYFIHYYIPDYLSIKDTTYLSLLFKNNKNFIFKFKLHFDILNGKYSTQKDKYLHVNPLQYQELLLFFKPEYKSTAKIKINHILPTEIVSKEFYIKLIDLPEINKKKNKFLRVKKYYYKLKYYSKNDIYYSKLKRAGWFGVKYDRGDDVVIRFRIKTKQKIKDIKIQDYIPAGFEYIGEKLKYHLYKIKPFKNYGIIQKDEKIIFHIPDLEKGVYNIYYILKAKFAGEYFLPGYTVIKNKKIFISYPEKEYVEIL